MYTFNILTLTILGYERLVSQCREAMNYVVTVIASVEQGRKEVETLISMYRYSSALRFQMFLNSMTHDNKFIDGTLYKTKRKFKDTDENHFDLIYVTKNGVICSTCNEYLEYGFYERHILALFVNGYIDLYPLHQCNSFWLKESDLVINTKLVSDWDLNFRPQKQEYIYNSFYSRYDTAYTLTDSSYSKVKNPIQTYTLERIMNFVSKQDVKELTQGEIVKQCLNDLKKLKIQKEPGLVQKLVDVTEEIREALSKKRKALVIQDEDGEEQTISQQDSYHFQRQKTKRTKTINSNKKTLSTIIDFTQKSPPPPARTLLGKLSAWISPCKT